MRISIITAVYNSGEYLRDAYASILSQSLTDWEWLVTDDCSTDNSLEVIREIAKGDQRVRVFESNKNGGAALARNTSISNAQGEFVCFLDSDDVWLPNKLELQFRFMREGINFSFTAYELVDKNLASLGCIVDSDQVGAFSYEDMLRKKATLGCSTVMLRKSAFNDLSMPLIRTGQDYALWLKLLKTGHDAHVLNNVLTQYRILPDSISRNKFKKAKRQWEIYRKIESLGLLKSLECFFFYAWRAVFRK